MVLCNSTLSKTHWEVDPVAGKLTLHTLGWIICIMCTVTSSTISLYHIYKHATTYTKPSEQRNIIRILVMVPVYSVTTMFSYVWYWHAVYWQFARDMYEAFAIAAFFSLMCFYVSPMLSGQKEYFATMTVNTWPWPVTWINRCTNGKWRQPRNGLTWFNIVWVSIFQYCFIRGSTTIIATTTQATGHYCEDSLHPAFAHFWVLFFNCLAVTLAMYMLIAFYLNLRTALAPNKPLLKLLCIKLVIFLCFWQMILLDFLGSAHIIKPTKKISPGDISVGFNALLVCLEMTIFSIMHLFAYPWKVYEISDLGPAVAAPKAPIWRALVDPFNPIDIIKAFARGVKWASFGYRRRHQEAEKVAARKGSKGNPDRKEEEGQGLVANAAGAPGSWPAHGVYGRRMTPGGLVVEHPTPNDQEDVPHPDVPHPDVPIYGLATTEHTGYRPLSVEMAPTQVDPDIRRHPAFLPVSPLADRRPGAPTSLPYPAFSSMPSIHGGSQPYGTPSPGESQELLGQHPAMRTPPWQQQLQPLQHPALRGDHTYSESMLDEQGVYRGPNPRRGDREDENSGRWREV